MDVYYKETNMGVGVFAGRDFRQGEVIVSSTGNVVRFQLEHSIQVGWTRHLDADPPARYLNHSCQPNVGARTNPEGLADFVALRNIQQGEEITFDYAMTEYTHYPRSDKSQDFDLTCLCEQPRCRGRLGYYAEITDELKAKYKGYFLDYLLEDPPEGHL